MPESTEPNPIVAVLQPRGNLKVPSLATQQRSRSPEGPLRPCTTGPTPLTPQLQPQMRPSTPQGLCTCLGRSSSPPASGRKVTSCNDSSCLPLSSPSPLDCFHRTYHTWPGILYSSEHRFIFYPCPFVRAGTLSAPFWARRAPGTEWQLSKRLCGWPGLPAQCISCFAFPHGLPASWAERGGEGGVGDIRHLVALWGHPQLPPEKPLSVLPGACVHVRGV